MDTIESSSNFEENQKENFPLLNKSEENIKEKTKEPKREKTITILKLFGKKLILFTSLRSLLNLIKLLIKIKLNIKKINLEKLLNVVFDLGNLKSGLFLS